MKQTKPTGIPQGPPYIFVAYPISNGFREKVACIAGPDAQYVFLAELRNRGFRGMVQFLRSMGKNSAVYIPLEDNQSEPLLPILRAVAAVSAAHHIFVIRPDGVVHAVGLIEMGRSLAALAVGVLLGIVALVRSVLAVRWLLLCGRAPLDVDASSSILYINANLWFGIRAGGSVGHVAGVANGLADQGYEVELASSDNQVMLGKRVRQILIRPPASFTFPYELNYFRHNYSVIRQLRRIARGHRYRFIYQRMSVMNFAGVLLSRRWRIPLVLEYNGSEIWVAKNWGRPLRFSRIGVAIENVCLRHAYRVVVVSQALADELVSRGVDADRIVCYPNCVDPKHYSPELVPAEKAAKLRSRYGIPDDSVLVAFVGTFGRWHGAPVLASAIKRLVDNNSLWLENNKVRFAMIGDGLTMKEVRELIGAPNYSKWVTFTGLVPQAETVAYLAAADIFVSPHVPNSDGTRFFGSPTKLFEYMAMEKAIIASDLDQIGDVLSSGIRISEQDQFAQSTESMRRNYPDATAILIRPGDANDLIAALRILIECPELRPWLAFNARQELLRRYTWEHHVARITRSLSPSPLQGLANVALAKSAE